LLLLDIVERQESIWGGVYRRRLAKLVGGKRRGERAVSGRLGPLMAKALSLSAGARFLS
jgi:hypothetical protein